MIILFSSYAPNYVLFRGARYAFVTVKATVVCDC